MTSKDTGNSTPAQNERLWVAVRVRPMDLFREGHRAVTVMDSQTLIFTEPASTEKSDPDHTFRTGNIFQPAPGGGGGSNTSSRQHHHHRHANISHQASNNNNLSNGFPTQHQTPPRQQQYSFDRVFDETVTQEEVYKNTAAPLVRSVLEGFYATVFAYGATGSGKTYTMVGTPTNPGIMARAVDDIFHLCSNQKEDLKTEVLFDIRRKVEEYKQQKSLRSGQTDIPRVAIEDPFGEPRSPHLNNLAEEGQRAIEISQNFEQIEIVQDAFTQLQAKDQKRGWKKAVKIQTPKPQPAKPVAVRVKEEISDAKYAACPADPSRIANRIIANPTIAEPAIAEKPTIIAKPAIAEDPTVITQPAIATKPAIIPEPTPAEKPTAIAEPDEPTLAHSDVLLSLAQLNATAKELVQENMDLAKNISAIATMFGGKDEQIQELSEQYSSLQFMYERLVKITYPY